MSNICKGCTFKKDCEFQCPALQELNRIADTQDKADKTMIIRNLIKRIGIRDCEKSNELRLLGNKIIKRFSQFDFIKEWNISIGYVVSQETKQGNKITYADCRKVPEVYRAYLPYDFLITFYAQNTDELSNNQKKVLMLHELQHITIGPRGLAVRPHDVEDFTNILSKYGLDWNEPGKEVPDILGGDSS